MELLKDAIDINDKYQKKNKKEKYVDPKIIRILERFIIEKQLICYGGIAINNILPKSDQFYDYDVDIPDYDFFSPTAMDHAKELSDIFAQEKYVYHVESKSAFFVGTYKVFVNFIPVADITQINENFYQFLLKNAIFVENIPYTHPDFLRMSLHQELSRPLGDVSRWEKIYKRMTILNKFYPIPKLHKNIESINRSHVPTMYNANMKKIVNKSLMRGTIFCNINLIRCIFQSFAPEAFQPMLKKECKRQLPTKESVYDDIMVVFVEQASKLVRRIKNLNIPELSYIKKESTYKFIKTYYELYIGHTLIGFVFELDSCMSYNRIELGCGQMISIGTIDTLLQLYFSILLIDGFPIHEDEIRLNIQILYNIVNSYDNVYENYLNTETKRNKYLFLSRFNLPCQGIQDDYEKLLKQRNEKFKLLKDNKKDKEYQKWFFKYIPLIQSDKGTSTPKQNSRSRNSLTRSFLTKSSFNKTKKTKETNALKSSDSRKIKKTLRSLNSTTSISQSQMLKNKTVKRLKDKRDK